MKIFAILLAVLVAQQCYSLPVAKSITDDSSDSSDSSSSEDIDVDLPAGHFSKEFILSPGKNFKNIDLSGVKTNDAKKTGLLNIDTSDDDSDADDDEMGIFETDSDDSMVLEDSSSSEQDLNVIKTIVKKPDSKPIAKADSKTVDSKPIIGKADSKPINGKADSKHAVVIEDSKPIIGKADSKPVIVKKDEKKLIKKADDENVNEEEDSKPVVVKTGIPAVRRIQDKPDESKYKPSFNKEPRPQFRRVSSNSEPKADTPEAFEKEIDALKKDIQRMKALGESDSFEDDEKDSGKDAFVGELIKKIKSLRDEIKVEKGMPVEDSNEVAESGEADDEDDSDSEEDDDDDIEVKAKDKNTSAEQEGIKNIKLSQTYDGKDSSEESDDEEFPVKTELVKQIESLKEEIKQERKIEDEVFPLDKFDDENSEENSEEYSVESEPVDEKLLSILKNLKVDEDLKDIKHLKVDEAEEKPLLDIEKPENLHSDEVKIGFIIANEAKDSQENQIIDLLNAGVIPPRVIDVEIIPIDIPPFEFPKKDIAEFIEIVEIPNNEVLNQGEIYNIGKDDAKKNLPNDSIIGGVFSKFGGIFKSLKKIF